MSDKKGEQPWTWDDLEDPAEEDWVDWEEVAAIAREGERLAGAGQLTEQVIGELVERARQEALHPRTSDPDVLRDLERRLRGLLP